MKKIYALISALVLTIAATAQTLNVKVGNVVYQYPASQTGDMTYSNGTSLTIMGKTFTLSDIDAMTVDNSDVTDNRVTVVNSLKLRKKRLKLKLNNKYKEIYKNVKNYWNRFRYN